MEEDRRQSDGIVIAAAIVLVLGLGAGGLFWAKQRAMARARAQLAQQAWGPLPPRVLMQVRGARYVAPAPKPATVTYLRPRGLSDDEDILFDSHGDWIYLRQDAERAARTVVFGIESAFPSVETDSLALECGNVPKSGDLVRVAEKATIRRCEVALSPADLATAIHALPQGTESIESFLVRIAEVDSIDELLGR